MNNYEKAPNVISCKDLNYLYDMFNWNYGIYKGTINDIPNVSNSEVKALLEEGKELFNNNMLQIINILGDQNGE